MASRQPATYSDQALAHRQMSIANAWNATGSALQRPQSGCDPGGHCKLPA
jgi:hypothetical protein